MMIRLASAEDIPQLLDIGEKAIKESGHPARFDRKKTRQMIFNLILAQRKGNNHRVWVLFNSGVVCGVFIGQIDTLYFSQDKYATDLIFYVLPEHRGHGVKLVRKFVEWASSHKKVVDITLQQSSGIDMERTSKLYARIGFKLVGGCFVKYARVGK